MKPSKNAATVSVAASAYPVKRNNPLTTAVNGLLESGRRGSNPRRPAWEVKFPMLARLPKSLCVSQFQKCLGPSE